MGSLNLRDFPDELHRDLKAQAARKGMSLRDYAVRLIGEGLKQEGGKTMSGAGAPQWKIDATIEYLTREFPDGEISWLPDWDRIADLFRVIKSSEVAHRLFVRRKFFDYHDSWPGVLAERGVSNRMRQAGSEIVELA